jgi:tetratricopeptide (TPR) repeat protein
MIPNGSLNFPQFVDNYRMVRDSYTEGKPLPERARPLRMEIQLGEHCDIRCIMCWQDHERPRALKTEHFDQISDMLPYVTSVLFTGGEATIYKDFWRLVERFKAIANPYAKLEILTHGQNLKDNIHRLEGIPNLYLAVNVDGPTRETYEKIRKGASWERLNDSLAAVAEARQRNPGWGLNTTFLLMRSNIDLIEQSIDFAERYDASWGCGMISGEYTPANQSRTYLEENLFRFGHSGYSPDQILARLESALPRAARHPHDMARAMIEATIQQVCSTRQIPIAPETLEDLRSIGDADELSRRLQIITLEDAKCTRTDLTGLRLKVQLAETGEDCGFGLANAATVLAMRLMEEGAFGEAEQSLRHALSVLRSADNFDVSMLATVQHHLGVCLMRQSKEGGSAELRDAWQALTDSLGAHATQTAETGLELGKSLNAEGHFTDAIRPLEQSYYAFNLIYGKQTNSSFVAVAAHELGRAYVETKRHIEAEPCLKKAMHIYKLHWGTESQHTLTALLLLARSYIERNAFDDADALLRPQLLRCEETLGNEHLLTQMTQGHLAMSDTARSNIHSAGPGKRVSFSRVYRKGVSLVRRVLS